MSVEDRLRALLTAVLEEVNSANHELGGYLDQLAEHNEELAALGLPTVIEAEEVP